MALARFAPKTLANTAMPESNQSRRLSFSNDWIESVFISGAHDVPVENAIVVNLSTAPLRYSAGANRGTILPWRSTMLRQCKLEQAESVAILQAKQRTNLGGVALGWEWYGQRNPQFPRSTPLYISSQDDLGDVQLDPIAEFTRENSIAAPQRYRMQLNLWYTPEETDCGIHTGHQFLEVHTQVLGTGHMQKFRENDAKTLYEDVAMLPGYTHDPFFVMGNAGGFHYPWHRYYAETDCIWMAIELHPL